MRQPCAQMVARAVQENLRFVFEPAKRARVNDRGVIALVMGAPVGRFFWILAAAGVCAELGVRREALPLQPLQFFARAGHDSNSEFGTRNSRDSAPIKSPATPARKPPSARTTAGSRLQSNCSGTTRRP